MLETYRLINATVSSSSRVSVALQHGPRSHDQTADATSVDFGGDEVTFSAALIHFLDTLHYPTSLAAGSKRRQRRRVSLPGSQSKHNTDVATGTHSAYACVQKLFNSVQFQGGRKQALLKGELLILTSAALCSSWSEGVLSAHETVEVKSERENRALGHVCSGSHAECIPTPSHRPHLDTRSVLASPREH